MARKPVYPLGVTGTQIGGPFQGTHAKDFNAAHGSDNWESENAVDIGVPTGTPVIAVQDGTIGQQIGPLNSGDPRMAGERLHLVSKTNEFYYAHLSKIVVKAGQRVRAGDVIGYSGAANGVDHLHFAVKKGNPEAALGGDVSAQAAPPQSGLPTDVASATMPEEARKAAINNMISQYGSPSPAASVDSGVAPPGSAPAVAPMPQPRYETWRMIANLPGGVSSDTKRLAALSELADGSGS